MRWLTIIAAATAVGWTTYVALDGGKSVPTVSGNSASRSVQKSREKARIFAAGIVEGVDAPVELRFESTGRVTAVRVSEGQSVQANQVLADQESEPSRMRVLQAKAQAEIAQIELNRIKERQSQPQSVIRRRATTAVESSEALVNPVAYTSPDELAIAHARLTSAHAAWKQEHLHLEKTQLKAPFEGVILAVNMIVGDLAGPAGSQVKLTLVNRAKTRVRAFVEELDALDVAVGQRAQVAVAGKPGTVYQGTVISCSPYVQPKEHRHLNPGERIDVRVRTIIVELKDGADLLIGLPVEVFLDSELGDRQ